MVNISICVPAFELGGRGSAMLTNLLESIQMQSYKDYEVIVSDHSVGDDIKNTAQTFVKFIDIKYIRNKKNRGSCEANLNNAIENATGEFVKPMLQDDFFIASMALKLMFERTYNNTWCAVGCMHCTEDDIYSMHRPHIPRWPSYDLQYGNNLIGSPSVVMYPRHYAEFVKFDNNLLNLMDCEFYYRLHKYIGRPVTIADMLICIRERHDSISSSMVTPELNMEEVLYVAQKIEDPSLIDFNKYPLMYERMKKCGLA